MVDINLVEKGGEGISFTKFKRPLPKTGIVIVVVLLIISLLSYGGLFYFKNKLNSQIESTKTELAELEKERDPVLEKEILSLEKVLRNLRTLLESHFYWSELFSKIEDLTQPKASFSNFGAKLGEAGLDVDLKGVASSYTTLAKQMVSFDEDPQITSVRVSGITLSAEGGVDFSMSLGIERGLLLK